jgi:hypothetical protein
MRGRRNTDAQNVPVHSPDAIEDAADSQPHDGPAAFDLTKPFDAMRALILRYAENTDTPITLDPVTGAQIQKMVAWGMAAAILAEMAASTGKVLNEWFPLGAPLDQVLACLDSTIAQPGWSPWPESALRAAKHIVAEYVSSPGCTSLQ